jgi:hypothetical protein
MASSFLWFFLLVSISLLALYVWSWTIYTCEYVTHKPQLF